VNLTRTFLLSFTTAAMLLVPAGTPAFFDDESSPQLQVTPRETEVFVDGYFAGKVDDFDGRFQRLHVQPGEHELTVSRWAGAPSLRCHQHAGRPIEWH
jgi:hypothetical protein